MTYTELHSVIRLRFATQVALPQELFTVYDNSDINPPKDSQLWCRWTIADGESRATAVGTEEYRLMGVAFAQLFCPVRTGDKAILAVADAIIAAFRGQSDSGVRFKSAYMVKVGERNGLYQVNVNCPFEADVIG